MTTYKLLYDGSKYNIQMTGPNSARTNTEIHYANPGDFAYVITENDNEEHWRLVKIVHRNGYDLKLKTA